ncbi:unnamed protein product [Auanema sp. JU1783]|nr:unnamed protein product [Auanema sp. JU1783]
MPLLEDLLQSAIDPSNKTIDSNSTRASQNETWDDHIIRDEDVEDDNATTLNTPISDGKTTRISISAEAGQNLYQHWTDQAVSGLMAAYATNRLKTVENDQVKKMHHDCTKSSKTVREHAKCVSELVEQFHKFETFSPPPLPKRNTGEEKKVVKSKRNRMTNKRKKFTKPKRIKFSPYKTMKLKKRVKRALKHEFDRPIIKRKKSYSLFDANTNNYKEPMAVIAKNLIKTIRSFKNKEEQPRKSWQDTIEEIEKEGILMKKRDKMKKLLQNRLKKFREDLKFTNETSTNEILLKNLEFSRDEDVGEVKLNDRDELMSEAKNAEKTLSLKDEMMRTPVKLIREGVKLGMALSGQDISNFDNKTIRMISPKLMALAPEEKNLEDTINLLSPTLLSFHNNSGIFSLPSLLNVFDNESQEEWMNFVFEASGVSDAVSMMKNAKAEAERKEMKEHFMSYTKSLQLPNETYDIPDMVAGDTESAFKTENISKLIGNGESRKIEHIEELQKTMTKEQLNMMNETGYAKMTDSQLNFFYGSGSPFEDSEVLARLTNVSTDKIGGAIEAAARMLAEGQAKFEVSRQRDIVLSPLTFTPIIASPETASQGLILSPILVVPLVYSPSIFGSVILSPWVFVPVIVSPRIMGPVILSPILFSPIVLSPIALIPIVLSPGVGLPLILSPMALCPFILSPVALTPIILSPFVLSPFIIIPNVLSPLILSPFVLSPLILSPPAVSAFILNPYALSPIIKSEGAVFTAVLSPSWLS